MSKPSCPNSTSMLREISRHGTGEQIPPKLAKCIPKTINSIPTTTKQSNSPRTTQVVLQDNCTCHHEELPKDFSPILNLLFHITLLIMVLTCTTIQYPIKVASILLIWTINLLIPPTEAELIVRHGQKREGNDSICIMAFPNNIPILTHYMLISRWLHILD